MLICFFVHASLRAASLEAGINVIGGWLSLAEDILSFTNITMSSGSSGSCAEFMVPGSLFKVRILGVVVCIMAQYSEFQDYGSEFKVSGLGFRDQGLRFKV